MSYSVLSAVKMTPYLRRSAQQIADKLDFDIVITSGLRTAAAQAEAMFYKIDEGDDLIALYADDSFAQGVIDAHENDRNVEQAIEFIQGYFNEGKGSAHGRGEALDIRTTGGPVGAAGQLTEPQITQLQNAINELGFSFIREQIPPHIDVRLPPAPAANEKKTNLILIGLIGIGLWMFLDSSK